MVSILVDEAYAYDYLAILQIKGTSPNYHSTISNCLEAQVGGHLHFEILESEEFRNLLDANQKTFEAVELARYWEISAKEVDNCNMIRYNCKNALQQKFFPSKQIAETKT